MAEEIGVLILHGVGIQKKGYSKSLEAGVNKLLENNGYKKEQIKYQEILYADIFDDQSEKRGKYLINTSAWWQVVTRSIRRLLIYVLSDAVSYRARYKRVHNRISENISELQNKMPNSTPVIVVAHSMGAIAISDYIYDLQNPKRGDIPLIEIKNLKSIITFGCNIPLFEMGHEKTVSISRPESDANEKDFFWTNFYSPFDVLGYRIERYYTEKPDFPIKDIKVFAGGVFTKWNLISHIGYWTHNEVHKVISKAIEKHIHIS